MAFDSSKPVDDSLVTAAELREQFNALKELSDAQQATIADLQSNVNDLSLQAGDNAAAITELRAAVAALQGNA